MAFRKTLAQPVLNITQLSSQSLTNCRFFSSSVTGKVSTVPDDPGENGLFRSPQPSGNLLDRLRAMSIDRSRIRLEGLTPPTPLQERVTVHDARKLLKVAQVEMVKAKLRGIPKSCITFPEFIGICAEQCSDQDQAVGIAQMLDDSATVIVLGDVVFLRPEQVAKAMEGLLPMAGVKVQESIRREFEEMERTKMALDKRADRMVRRELWGGLGFLMVQTVAFMRLTFWELTWDVMEPICFYLTSMYFMAGYAFFLRTSKEPSFEGVYQTRFSCKQKRLMKLQNFDIQRYNQLRAVSSPITPPPPKFDPSIALSFHNSSIHQ